MEPQGSPGRGVPAPSIADHASGNRCRGSHRFVTASTQLLRDLAQAGRHGRTWIKPSARPVETASMACRRAAVLAVTALALTVTAPAAAAPTITQYPGFNEGGQPLSITTGADGNLWFALGGVKAIESMTPAGVVAPHETSEKLVAVTAAPDGKVWFAQAGAGEEKLGTVDPLIGVPSYFPLSGTVGGITAGPEGDVWYTVEHGGGFAYIGRFVPSTEEITEVKITKSSKPAGITVGPEGDLWFTETAGAGKIGRFDPATKAITEYTSTNGLAPSSVPTAIASGPDGNVWFTEIAGSGAIGRINAHTGAITQFSEGLTQGKPEGIAAGSDGNLYFTESGGEGAVGQITASGVISEYKGGTIGLSKKAEPWGITSGPDGNIWFTEKAKPARIGQLTVAPSVASPAATNVTTTSATLSASVGPNAQETTYVFEYGLTASYGGSSVAASAGSGGTPVPMSAAIGGLSPATIYHFRVVAYNGSGMSYGTDATFTTAASGGGAPPSGGAPSSGSAPPSAPTAGSTQPQPVLGSSAGTQPTAGTVLVQQPSGAFVRLSGARTLPIGTVIDATHGTVRLITAIDRRGRTQSVTIWGGVFALRQSEAEDGNTRIVLKGALPSCHRGRGARASSARSKVKSRKLWAADNHGKYSTYGANSVATVLGTRWETIDSCAGTLTRVASGQVRVRDLHRHKTVLVSAGHGYLARR
jgi:streptogramin lyase